MASPLGAQEDLLPPDRPELSAAQLAPDHYQLSTGDRLYGDADLSFDYRVAPGEHAALFLEGAYRIPLAAWSPQGSTADDRFRFAAKSPGLWQHVHLVFHAPVFDAARHKSKDARIDAAELNQFPVLAGSAYPSPSDGAPIPGENPANPLVFLSDHPLQVRRLEFRPLPGAHSAQLEVTQVEELKAPVRSLDWTRAAAVPATTPLSELPNDSAFRFTARLTLPSPQDYILAAHANGVAQIYVDGAHVLAPVPLDPGPHRLQVTYVRSKGENSQLSVEIAAQRLPAQTFYLGGTKPKPNPEQHTGPAMSKLAGDRIVVQRSFVPFPGGERLETISVGTPDQLNYTYDLDRGTLLRAWRGPFLDMYNMWHERGEAQVALPLGAAVVFDGEPVFGEILQPGGYDLEANGQPTFTAHFHGRTVEDRIAANAAGTGLTRTLRISAGPEPVTLYLAQGGAMAEVSPNHFTASDCAYYLDWHPQPSETHPEITGKDAKSAMIVTLPASAKTQEISYDITW